MKRTFAALVVGFIFLVPIKGWTAQPGGTLPEQVASLAAQVAELKGLVANLTTQLNDEVTERTAGSASTLASAKAYTDQQVANEVAARQAAVIPIDPRVGMDFNDLYRQIAEAGCGWLQMKSKKGDVISYHAALSKPGCNPNILYHFQGDQLVKIDSGQVYEQR
jgi:hypothetical protein